MDRITLVICGTWKLYVAERICETCEVSDGSDGSEGGVYVLYYCN